MAFLMVMERIIEIFDKGDHVNEEIGKTAGKKEAVETSQVASMECG